jgi:fluoride ion exporter CrcB/FEX
MNIIRMVWGGYGSVLRPLVGLLVRSPWRMDFPPATTRAGKLAAVDVGM